jgi:AraC-like DNA-binding protein
VTGVHAVQLHSARAFDKHWHDSFGVGLMDEGGQVSASGRGPVQALAGDIITTNPGEVHDGVPLQQRARRWRMLYLTPSALADLVDFPQVTSLELTRPVLHDATLRHALATLLTAWDAHTVTEDPALLEEQLAQACALLVQRHGNQGMGYNSNAPSLEAVKACLLDQTDAPPTLADLARVAGLSRFQLVRQFAKAHGLPPFAWLRQHQLHRAQALIAKGSSLSAAALDSGFADQSHLTRSFVRHFGFTPGVWQRAQRGAISA